MTSVGKKICVLVVGMHRGGTSCAAGVLAKLNYAAPSHSIGADEDNPKGHWESTAVARLNDAVLNVSGVEWNDWVKLPDSWMDSPKIIQLIERGKAIVEEEYGDSPMIMLKDPRISRIYPFWNRVMDELGFEIVNLLPVRHPLEVAQSLHARNELAISEGLLLWQRYMLDAEFATRGSKRFYVNYPDLLEDWRKVMSAFSERTGAFLPSLGSRLARDVDGFIDQDLRRQTSRSGEFVPQSIQDTFEILCNWGRLGEKEVDLAKLDSERQGLDSIGRHFARNPQIFTGRKARQAVKTATKGYDDALRDLIEAHAGGEDVHGADDQSTGERFKFIGKLLRDNEAAIQQQAEAISALKEELRERDGRILAFDGAVAEDRGRLAHLKSELDQRRAELDSIYGERDKLLAQLAVAREKLDETSSGLATRNEQIAAQAAELETVRLESEERRAATEQHRAELENLHGERDELRSELAIAQKEREEANSALKAQADSLEVAKADAIRADSENGVLRRQLMDATTNAAAAKNERDTALRKSEAIEQALIKSRTQTEALEEQVSAQIAELENVRLGGEKRLAEIEQARTRLQMQVDSGRRELTKTSDQLAESIEGIISLGEALRNEEMRFQKEVQPLLKKTAQLEAEKRAFEKQLNASKQEELRSQLSLTALRAELAAKKAALEEQLHASKQDEVRLEQSMQTAKTEMEAEKRAVEDKLNVSKRDKNRLERALKTLKTQMEAEKVAVKKQLGAANQHQERVQSALQILKAANQLRLDVGSLLRRHGLKAPPHGSNFVAKMQWRQAGEIVQEAGLFYADVTQTLRAMLPAGPKNRSRIFSITDFSSRTE
jgi:hypothetical protein